MVGQPAGSCCCSWPINLIDNLRDENQHAKAGHDDAEK